MTSVVDQESDFQGYEDPSIEQFVLFGDGGSRQRLATQNRDLWIDFGAQGDGCAEVTVYGRGGPQRQDTEVVWQRVVCHDDVADITAYV